MVRRVGFGRDAGEARETPKRPARQAPAAPPPKPPKPPRAAAARGREPAVGKPPKGAPTGAATGQSSRPSVGRLIAAVFLFIWLAGWTVGLLAGIAAFSDEAGGGDTFDSGFLAIWIAVAGIAWLFAARALLRLLRGQPIRARKTDATRPPATSRRRVGRDPGDRGGGAGDGDGGDGGDGGGD